MPPPHSSSDTRKNNTKAAAAAAYTEQPGIPLPILVLQKALEEAELHRREQQQSQQKEGQTKTEHSTEETADTNNNRKNDNANNNSKATTSAACTDIFVEVETRQGYIYRGRLGAVDAQYNVRLTHAWRWRRRPHDLERGVLWRHRRRQARLYPHLAPMLEMLSEEDGHGPLALPAAAAGTDRSIGEAAASRNGHSSRHARDPFWPQWGAATAEQTFTVGGTNVRGGRGAAVGSGASAGAATAGVPPTRPAPVSADYDESYQHSTSANSNNKNNNSGAVLIRSSNLVMIQFLSAEESGFRRPSDGQRNGNNNRSGDASTPEAVFPRFDGLGYKAVVASAAAATTTTTPGASNGDGNESSSESDDNERGDGGGARSRIPDDLQSLRNRFQAAVRAVKQQRQAQRLRDRAARRRRIATGAASNNNNNNNNNNDEKDSAAYLSKNGATAGRSGGRNKNNSGDGGGRDKKNTRPGGDGAPREAKRQRLE